MIEGDRQAYQLLDNYCRLMSSDVVGAIIQDQQLNDSCPYVQLLRDIPEKDLTLIRNRLQLINAHLMDKRDWQQADMLSSDVHFVEEINEVLEPLSGEIHHFADDSANNKGYPVRALQLEGSITKALEIGSKLDNLNEQTNR